VSGLELPKLQLDQREVIEARLTSSVELQSMALTGLLAAYLALRQSLTVEGSLDRSLGAYDAAAIEPSSVMGSAAEEPMVCRLFAGGDWIRTSSTRKR
jgi:hypothetical protein